MLRIPTTDERPPPLMLPLRVVPAAAHLTTMELPIPGMRRRERKMRQEAQHAWDSVVSKASHFHRGENRRMLGMLIGGGCLLVLLIVGASLALRGRSQAPPVVAGPSVDKSGSKLVTPEPAPPNVTARSEVETLTAVEPLARKFLTATRVADLLPLIRNPDVAAARMQHYYPEGKVSAPGLISFNTDSAVVRLGTISAIKVVTRDGGNKTLAFVETPQGIKIDWESWVGWSEMPWEEFLKSKPTTGVMFRLNVKAANYYNFAFTNDQKWQAYQLTQPDGETAIYGYAERGSEICAKLPRATDNQPVSIMLTLKFPVAAGSNNQVLIERFVADGWVLESEVPP